MRPLPCLALVVGELDSAGKLVLMSTCHAARWLVLSHIAKLKLSLHAATSQARLKIIVQLL